MIFYRPADFGYMIVFGKIENGIVYCFTYFSDFFMSNIQNQVLSPLTNARVIRIIFIDRRSVYKMEGYK